MRNLGIPLTRQRTLMLQSLSSLVILSISMVTSVIDNWQAVLMELRHIL